METVLLWATGALTWVFSGITFWLFVILCIGGSWSVLSARRPSAEWASFWLGLLTFGVLWAKQDWFWWLVGNPWYAVGAVGAYLIIGFIISMTKWYLKVSVVRTAIKAAKREFIADLNAGRLTNGNRGFGQNAPAIDPPTHPLTETAQIKREWSETFNYFIKHNTKVNRACDEQDVKLAPTAGGGLGPDQDDAPIKTWWFFWPFAVSSVIYIPLSNIVSAWYERTRGLYKRISGLGSTDSMFES